MSKLHNWFCGRNKTILTQRTEINQLKMQVINLNRRINGLNETVHLLSNVSNAIRLSESIEQKPSIALDDECDDHY
jgi:hypothetical protein